MSRFSISGGAVSIAAILGRWIARHEQRQSLLELDDRLLRDIGISRGDARREAERPFWRGMDGESLVDRLEARNRSALAAAQPRFTAFSEKDSASRGCPSGSRKRPGLSAGFIIGNSR
jgi:uncharacterized protein YjiS (DUF1127 family)